MHTTRKGRVVRFGAFEVEMDSGTLRKHGARLKLQGRPFQILEALLEKPGEVVTRDELRDCLWPADTFVDFESGLNTAANRLRIALGDSAENPRYVETVARTGYRFIGTVTEVIGTVTEAGPTPARDPVSPAATEGPSFLEPDQTVRRSARPRLLSIAGAVSLALIALLASRAMLPRVKAQPSFRRVTFRQGTLSNARFGPDGQTILYSAMWDAEPARIYVANTVSPESRQLEFEGDTLVGVSASAELGLLKSDPAHGNYLLSRVPLNGGSPLAVVSGVSGADWGPAGRDFAVFRNGARDSVIEYPPGHVVYRSAGEFSDLRLSPNGAWIAFVEHPLRGDDAGSIKLMDRSGAAREMGGKWASVGGLAWLPSGREIWFTADRSGVRHSVFGVGLNGRVRQIATLPGMTMLYDISNDGRVLLGTDTSRMMVSASIDKEPERDLSWFDWSHVEAISSEGRYLLFDETGDGGGPNHSVYLRDTRTGSSVRLGDGQAVALSPDLKWALSLDNRKPGSLNLLPLTAQAPRTLWGHGLEYSWARYFPDGTHLLVGGHMAGKALRLYLQAVNGGPPVAMDPEIYLDHATISPDGKLVAGGRNRTTVIVPASGGTAREIPAPYPAAPVAWSSDGGILYVRDLSSHRLARITRFDLTHSSVRPWKELAPADKGGLDYVMNTVISPDGRSYAYSYLRDLSELYVVDGWS